MIEQIIFLGMIVMAIFCVTAANLRKTIVGLGVFSLLATVCYLIYHAPDVAIAEAVIGSAISTILYIIALKKYSSFYIYFSSSIQEEVNDLRMRLEKSNIRGVIREYCVAHELAPQIVYTQEDPDVVAAGYVYDLILHDDGNQTTVYGIETDDHYTALKEQLEEHCLEEGLVFANIKEEK